MAGLGKLGSDFAAVTAVQPNTVVVLHNGSLVECPWAEDVAAVLEMYLARFGMMMPQQMQALLPL